MTLLLASIAFLIGAVLLILGGSTRSVGRSERNAMASRRIGGRWDAPFRPVARRINEAGLSDRLSVTQALVAKLVGLFAGGLCGVALLARFGGISGVASLVGAPIAGFLLVDVLLIRAARTRRDEIERQLPDVLDQLVVMMEAGLGFEAALARIASIEGPLADELGRALHDVQLGMSRDDALRGVADRTAVGQLRFVIRALNQADRSGVPVARVLRTQAEEVRTQRRQRAEEKAMRMPVKLVFPLVMCILPALFVVLIGPAVLRIAQNGIGV